MVIFSISAEYSENSRIISSVMAMAPHRLHWAARSENAWSSSFFECDRLYGGVCISRDFNEKYVYSSSVHYLLYDNLKLNLIIIIKRLKRKIKSIGKT